MSRRDFFLEQSRTSVPATVSVDSKKVLTYEALWQHYKKITVKPRSCSQNNKNNLEVASSHSPRNTQKNPLKKVFSPSLLFKSYKKEPRDLMKDDKLALEKEPSDSMKVALENLIEELCSKEDKLSLQHPLSSDHYGKLIKVLAFVRNDPELRLFVDQLEKEFDLSAMPPLRHEINPDSVSTACIPTNRIGEGKFATVYRLNFTRESGLVKSVAIKKYKSDPNSIDPISSSMYKNERKILEILRKHPCSRYIVQSFGELDWHLIFEFAPFKNLSEYADQNPIPIFKIELIILSKILLGLDFLLIARIIHLDLKLANVVMGYNHDPKIADFGLSKYIPEDQEHLVNQSIVGTPYYMAPEMSIGKISFATDIFSFAILACALLARELPYKGVLDQFGYLDTPKFLRLINQGYRPQLPKDPQLQEINQQIEACWNSKPSLRPSPRVVSSIFQTQAEKYSDPAKQPTEQKSLQKSKSFQHV